MVEGYIEKGYDDFFELVEETVSSIDMSKNSTDYTVIMLETKTGKFWSAELGKSPWCNQDEYNARQEWHEVFKKTYTKTNKQFISSTVNFLSNIITYFLFVICFCICFFKNFMPFLFSIMFTLITPIAFT